MESFNLLLNSIILALVSSWMVKRVCSSGVSSLTSVPQPAMDKMTRVRRILAVSCLIMANLVMCPGFRGF